MNLSSLVFERSVLVAQSSAGEGLVEHLLGPLLMAAIFSGLGIVVLMVSFLVVAKLLPFSLRKEIEEDQNTSLAIVIGSIILGLSIIIAAAMIG